MADAKVKTKWTDTIDSALKNGAPIIRKEKELGKALDNCCVTMENITAQLAATDYTQTFPCEHCGRRGLEPAEAGKTLSYLAKMVNDITRLLEFAKGNADQRAEIKGLDELLKFLSHEQFQTVCKWMAEREFETAKQLN